MAVELTVGDGRGRKPRTVVVTTLRSELPARYREWVNANRGYVAEATGGRVGYVHIPDMGAHGYAEFHRSYLAEVERDALVVDVRFNGGGHVSQLILEKLARRRIGYDIQRWGPPEPYPDDSPAGPMVAITNERAGSDGDIFTHCFKLLGLGPVVGKRTWGGVIGINPSHVLADGSMTTQPEYSFWFSDVGWGVENYGTDPDYDVDIRPQDYAAGKDPQLDKAIWASSPPCPPPPPSTPPPPPPCPLLRPAPYRGSPPAPGRQRRRSKPKNPPSPGPPHRRGEWAPDPPPPPGLLAEQGRTSVGVAEGRIGGGHTRCPVTSCRAGRVPALRTPHTGDEVLRS